VPRRSCSRPGRGPAISSRRGSRCRCVRSRARRFQSARRRTPEPSPISPKGDGRLIVGATVEERGFDDALTAGGLYALLEGARRAFPAIEEMAIDAVWTGFRPSSVDDSPILGMTSIPGLALATGHHRNGYLLAPATAFAMEALMADGAMPAVARPFGLDRFGVAADHRQLEHASGIST